MIPHVSTLIKNWFIKIGKTKVYDETFNDYIEPEICLIEIGGTVGDIESMI